jgi:hypothetical protein
MNIDAIAVAVDSENEALCIMDKLCNRDYKMIMPHVSKIKHSSFDGMQLTRITVHVHLAFIIKPS